LPQPTKTPPPRWLFPESRGLVVPAPFPDDPGQIATQGKAQNLIAQASWAQCEERTKCLYETQLIHGQIVQAINSDIPGAVWIKVTNQVTDMFGEGQVLIPQGATLVGAQQGLPKAGDNRLEFLLQRGVFPDGTVLSFAGSRLGDATGAAGLSGAVDNHYWQLGIATILTAALSVGAREVGGTSGGFRATPEEDFAKEIAGSTNTTGREIVRRQLVKGPTITLTQGTPVVVQLKETLSLQTPPTIVRQ
jgi:type IV secretion system protein VirB10